MATALRQKLLVLPPEHGAWGLLLIPLVTGASVGLLGGNGWSLAPLTIAALALLWLRTPIESWMGTAPVRTHAAREIRLLRNTAVGLAAIQQARWFGCFGAGAIASFCGSERQRDLLL